MSIYEDLTNQELKIGDNVVCLHRRELKTGEIRNLRNGKVIVFIDNGAKLVTVDTFNVVKLNDQTKETL